MKKILLSLLAIVLLLIVAFFVVMNFFPATFVEGYRMVEHSKAGYQPIKTITVNGYTWHYLDTLDEEGQDANASKDQEVILMVHGIGGDKDNWTLLAPQLKQRLPNYRLIAVDLPGFGDNARDRALAYNIPKQAERLHGFMQALGLPPVHLAGNSMGGHIAGYLTAEHPDAVKTLILLNNAGVEMPVKSQMVLALEQAIANPELAGKHPLFVDDAEDYDRLLKFVFVEPPPIPGPIKTYFAEKAAESATFNKWVFMQIVDPNTRLEPKLPSIQEPVLIIWGDTDRVLDKSMVKVMEPLLTNETVLILKNTGHLPMAERPEQVADAMHEFIQKSAE